MKHVVIAGGGTGGHLYPGIAIARELLGRRREVRISFVGTSSGIERTVVPREGFELDLIRSGGLKGKGLGTRLRGVSLLPVSLVDAWRVISRRRPSLVVGVGGYSSGPVVLLAALRRIPTLVLEQNAMPGLTNRLLAPFIDAAAVAYETSLGYFRGQAFVAGNPVRPEFLRTRPEVAGSSSPGVRVLVFGGSQGAHAINVVMAGAALRLAAVGYELVHQTGERDCEMIRSAFQRAGLKARVEPFLYEMDREMHEADIVVCRAGATTVAELSAAGRPALLIPLPTAADDHQRKNAEVMRGAGAADVIDQAELTSDMLADRIAALAADPARRQKMAGAARRLARPDAATRIVDRALELIGD